MPIRWRRCSWACASITACPAPPGHHDIFCHDISAPFEAGALQQAVAELVAVHPILRTRFALTGFSEPLQLVERETLSRSGSLISLNCPRPLSSRPLTSSAQKA